MGPGLFISLSAAVLGLMGVVVFILPVAIEAGVKSLGPMALEGSLHSTFSLQGTTLMALL